MAFKQGDSVTAMGLPATVVDAKSEPGMYQVKFADGSRRWLLEGSLTLAESPLQASLVAYATTQHQKVLAQIAAGVITTAEQIDALKRPL